MDDFAVYWNRFLGLGPFMAATVSLTRSWPEFAS